MPVQVQKSGLLAKLGGRIGKHKMAAPVVGNPTLPSGIENGVAQLVKCSIGEFKEGKNKGQPFFMAMGVVVDPPEHEGISLIGLQTKCGPEPLCDTPDAQGKRKTADDHLAYFIGTLKALGLKDHIEQNMPDDPTGVKTGAFLEECCKTLEKAQPYFRFRTWKGQPSAQFPNPRVNEQWNGITEWGKAGANGQAAATSGVQDNSAQSTDASSSTSSGDGSSFNEFTDVEVLAGKADGGDEKAMEDLEKAGLAAGMTQEEIDGANNWMEVAQTIATKLADSGDSSSENNDDETPWEPTKGEVVTYQPPGKNKAKKPFKPVEVEVTSVNKKAKTVNATNADDKKTTYKDISWDALTPHE